jgi:hypothetical protein
MLDIARFAFNRAKTHCFTVTESDKFLLTAGEAAVHAFDRLFRDVVAE